MTVPIQLIKNDEKPLYLQLAEKLKEKIETGDLKPQAYLPSIRKMAQQLNVNNSTVVQAYKHLESESLISSKKGSGYFVNRNYLLAVQNQSLSQTYQDMTKSSDQFSVQTINFSGATPSLNLFPIQTFHKYMNYVFERDQALAFGYQDVLGYEPLRASFSDYLNRYQQLKVDSDDITIISGAQQGIDLVSKLLVQPGQPIFVEKQTYYGALGAFQMRGAHIVSIDLTKEGMDLDNLEKQLHQHKPKLVYVMTKFQNPTTISYSETSLKKLLHLAEVHDFYILEEDSISELTYHVDVLTPPLKSYDINNRVIYLKSFSKLMMPGLRMGLIIVPPILKNKLIEAKRYTDISTSGVIQRAVDLFIRTGDFDDYLEQFTNHFKEKYLLMSEKLKELNEFDMTYDDPKGGLYFWIKLPPQIDGSQLYELCQQQQLKITPGYIFNSEDSKDNSYIRLSFADCTDQQINRGFFILKQNIKKLRKD